MIDLPADLPNRRGFTLVELMIVVAIIGVLAAIAGVAYTKYIKSAKITKLRQYAMEIANAQEQYKSQNSQYLNIGAGNGYDETQDSPKWKQLLGFDKKGLDAAGVDIYTVAGFKGEDCDDDVCGASADPGANSIWYAVAVTQDMDPSNSERTTVRYYTGMPNPIVLNEGE